MPAKRFAPLFAPPRPVASIGRALFARPCILLLLCLLTAGTAAFAPAATAAEKDADANAPVPVIYDTDIGEDIDDTWALVYLLRSPEAEVKLITTGFVSARRKAHIVAKILERIERIDVPVGVGVGPHRSRTNYRPWVDGFRPDAYKGTIHDDGVAKLIETVHADKTGRLKILAVGPMQTLAEALRRDPSIAPKVELIAMAGHFGHLGTDAKPKAESNVRSRVDAARKVFAADWKRIIVVPAEVSKQVQLDDERYQHVLNSDDPGAKVIGELYRAWRKNIKWTNVNPDVQTSRLYDVLAVHMAWSTDPVTLSKLPMAITDRGQTVVDRRAGHNVQVAAAWADANARWAFNNGLARRVTGSLPAGGVRLPVRDLTASAEAEHARKTLLDGRRRRHGKAWSVATDSAPGWVQFELPGVYDLRQVKIAFANGNVWTEAFEIRVSTDAETWKTVLDTRSGGKTRDFEAFALTPVRARHVRLVLKGHGTWHPTPIGGVRLYGLLP